MQTAKNSTAAAALVSQEDHARLTRTRAENARALFQAYAEEQLAAGAQPLGLQEAFAKHIEVSASMWSQIKSSRPIGNKIARQIEAHCGVEEGWLDKRREAAADTISQGEQLALAIFLKAFRTTNSVGRKNLTRLLREVGDGKLVPEAIFPHR